MGWRPGSLLTCGVTLGALSAFAGTGAAATGFAPTEALPGAGPPSASIQTAMAANGFAIAGWAETLSGGQSAIRVSTRPPGGPWSASQSLDVTSAARSLLAPISVAIDAAGDATIAWDNQAGAGDNSLVSTRAAGQQSFGAPQTVMGGTDPAVGVDSAGQVTMLDTEAGNVRQRTWQAGGTVPGVSGAPLATGCSTFTPTELADAPDGDAVAGLNCGGDTFLRRVAGVWSETTPVLDGTFGSCGGGFVSSTSGGPVRVAIDAQGRSAGVFLETVTSGTDCSNESFTSTINLVLDGVAVTPAVDMITSFGVGTGLGLGSPDVAIGGGSELLGWTRSPMTGTTDQQVQLFDAAGHASGAATTLGTTALFEGGHVALSPSGYAIATFPTPDLSTTDVATRAPGGEFPVSATPLAAGASGATVAIDDAGDGLAGFSAASQAQARGFDVSPPALTSTSIPGSGTAGTPASFSAVGTDFWGPVTLSWNFGDGATATGASVTHTFASAATHTVTVTATDAVGNTATQSGSIAVQAEPVLAPVLSDVSETHKRFKRGHGTAFKFTLNEAASITIRIDRRRKQHEKHRFKLAGTLNVTGKAGANRVAFGGRIGKRKLPPGTYRVTITATAGNHTSKPATLSFTILPGG